MGKPFKKIIVKSRPLSSAYLREQFAKQPTTAIKQSIRVAEAREAKALAAEEYKEG